MLLPGFRNQSAALECVELVFWLCTEPELGEIFKMSSLLEGDSPPQACRGKTAARVDMPTKSSDKEQLTLRFRSGRGVMQLQSSGQPEVNTFLGQPGLSPAESKETLFPSSAFVTQTGGCQSGPSL